MSENYRVFKDSDGRYFAEPNGKTEELILYKTLLLDEEYMKLSEEKLKAIYPSDISTYSADKSAYLYFVFGKTFLSCNKVATDHICLSLAPFAEVAYQKGELKYEKKSYFLKNIMPDEKVIEKLAFFVECYHNDIIGDISEVKKALGEYRYIVVFRKPEEFSPQKFVLTNNDIYANEIEGSFIEKI